jgi:hypothetical protein
MLRASVRTAAIGDALIFLLFPVLGSTEHGTGLTLSVFWRTLVPFALAWAVVGVPAGVFAKPNLRSVRRTIQRVPIAWLAAGVLGLVARGLFFERPFILSFALVAVGVLMAMLTLWRLALAALSR